MELSKLIICRQDVVVLSDTETDEANLNKKKKLKTKCVRNVQLTKTTVDRIVPNCYRPRCRSGHHYHRLTSKNTKYMKRRSAPEEKEYKKIEAPPKKTACKSEKYDNDTNSLPRDLYSPITIDSSSDLYENISSCSFNVMSSDSDELEDLISITRKRMKNDNGNFNNYRVRQAKCTTTTQDDYQNISSNDEAFDSSIHSMDTVVLYAGDTNSPPRSPDHINQLNNNNNIEPALLQKGPKNDSGVLLEKEIPSITRQDTKGDLSPLYEISGKVFMEHYLNTSIF